MTILETVGLRHDFGGPHVLMGIDLQISQGERHAVIGPNGAGKTTLFNVITGACPPRHGRVIFKGRDVTGFRPHELARMGMGRSFQITSTFQKLTAFENMRLPVLSRLGVRFNLLRKVDNMPTITADSEEALRRFHLLEARDVQAGLLSYGMGRGLEVGLAMAAQAELVMLDEPAAGMSKTETRHMVNLIRRLTDGKTVLVIEHDMDVVFSLADRITVLHRGAVLATGAPEEIRRNEAVKDAYLGREEV